MPKPKPLSIPVGQDPKGWSDIRSAWSRHQVANQGDYEMEILRNFLVPTLADLASQPDRLSPEAYARFFNTMAPQVPWKKFGTYQQDVRVPIMISIGILAERSGSEKSLSGKGIPAQWMSDMKKAFDAMIFLSSIDTRISEDMVLFLDSPLSDSSKLRICKNFTFPDTWLQPEIIGRLRPLLPEKAQEAFKFFPWAESNPSANQTLVSTYLPDAYTLLDLSLPEAAWETQATVAKAIADMGAVRKNKANSVAFELPSDFLGEP